MLETLVVKKTWVSSFTKWGGWILLGPSGFNFFVCKNDKFRHKTPKWTLFHQVIFFISPRWFMLLWSLNSLAQKLTGPTLLWASRAQIVHGADTPSVCLQTGVKFEHFVYPLRVEGNIYKKRRLWWCTFCPLDAHTNDDFALMFLTNQWATIVFLQEKGEKNN